MSKTALIFGSVGLLVGCASIDGWRDAVPYNLSVGVAGMAPGGTYRVRGNVHIYARDWLLYSLPGQDGERVCLPLGFSKKTFDNPPGEFDGEVTGKLITRSGAGTGDSSDANFSYPVAVQSEGYWYSAQACGNTPYVLAVDDFKIEMQ